MSNLRTFFSHFSKKEFVVLGSTVVISLSLLVSVLVSKPKEETQTLVYLYPHESAINTSGKTISLFASEFALAYENSDDETLEEIRTVLDQTLVPLHKLFDRHEYYYADKNATSGELLHNLRYLNQNKGQQIEIDYHLYNVLAQGKTFSMRTLSEEDNTSSFNFYIGKIYDFWEPFFDKYEPLESSDDPIFNPLSKSNLEALVNALPKTTTEVDEALTLTEEEGKYYAFLKPGDYEITFGALGKGYAADVIEAQLTAKGLINGAIYGAASTITFLKAGIFDKAINITVDSINNEVGNYSYKFSRSDQYRMSTSGTYQGRQIVDGEDVYLRAHIVEPTTGYTPDFSHQIVSIVSTDFSSLELDYLTTQLMVSSVSDGQAFLAKYYPEHDYNLSYVGVLDSEYYVSFSPTFLTAPGIKITINEGYREKNLEIL